MPSYSEIRPNPRLARYVECYWQREDDQGTPHHSVLPDGCVDILYTGRHGEPVSLNVVGLMTSAQAFGVDRGTAFFGVRFHPGMAAAFLRETALLTDKVIALDDVAGAAGARLFDRLANASGTQEMISAVEGMLRPLEPPDAAERFLCELPRTELSLDDLTEQTGLSVRHARRECLKRAGVSPKYLSRIIRFRKASERISALVSSGGQVSWAQFAAACGYYDQAHFIREFQEFAGCTPGRFLQSLRG